MRQTFFPILFFILGGILLIPATQAQDETYLLQNKFQEGEVSKLVYSVTNEGATTMNSTQFNIDSALEIVMKFTTQELKENIATIQYDIEKMILDDPGTSAEPIDLLETWDMSSQETTFKINQAGRLIDGMNLPEQQSGGISGLANAGKSYMQQNPYLSLPDEAIPIDYSWSEDRVIPFPAASKEMISYTTFTLEKVHERNGDQIAHLATHTTTFNENVKIDTSDKQMGPITLDFRFKEYSMDGHGYIEFNIDKGRIETIYDQADMIIDLSGETNMDNNNLPTNFVMKYTMNATGRVETVK